jgi:hypothetical protein
MWGLEDGYLRFFMLSLLHLEMGLMDDTSFEVVIEAVVLESLPSLGTCRGSRSATAARTT